MPLSNLREHGNETYVPINACDFEWQEICDRWSNSASLGCAASPHLWQCLGSAYECQGCPLCGFELHPGSISLGCITTDKKNVNAMKQYAVVNQLLVSEDGANSLVVKP
jgi:hypothetical protein